MNRTIILSLTLVIFVGCSLFRPAARVQSPQYPGSPSDVRFERTPEQVTEVKSEIRLVTVRFAGCNFRDGMRQLTELTGVPISWDKSLDNETIDGVFVEQPLTGYPLIFYTPSLPVLVFLKKW